MVKVHNLSPIYSKYYQVGSTLGTIQPQKEIKNLINQINFKDNILKEYDNWTFHIQWYMIPYNDFIAREYAILHSDADVNNVIDGIDENQTISGVIDKDFYKIDPSEKVVIFETGVTAQYAFENLSYKTVYSENDLNGFIHMTNMTFKFKEVNGCTFRDKWQVVSRALGYDNNINVPYFMEIDFVGYNRLTGKPERILPNPYLFKLAITGVDAQINNTGTSYTVKMVPHTQYGFSKDNFVAENLGKIGNQVGGGTFRQAIESLEETLNKKFFEIADNFQLKKYYPSDDTVNVVDPATKDSKLEISRRWQPDNSKKNENMTMIPTMEKASTQQTPYGSNIGKRYIFVVDSNIADVPLHTSSVYYTQTGETTERQIAPQKTIDGIVKELWHNIQPQGRENTEVRVFTKQVIVGKRPDGGVIERIYYFIVPYIAPFVEYYFIKYEDKIKKNQGAKTKDQPIKNLAEHINYLQSAGLLNRRYEYMFSGRDTSVLNFDFKINGLWYLKSPSELGKMIDYNLFDKPEDEISNEITPKTLEDWFGEKVSSDILRQTAKEIFDYLYKKYTQTTVAPTSVKYMDDINDMISDFDKVVYLNYGKIPERPDNTSVTDKDTQPNENEYTPILRRTALEEMHSCGKMCQINFEILGDPYWLGDETFDNSLMRIKQCVYGNHEIIFNVKTPAQRDKITGEQMIDTSTTVSGFYIVTAVEHNFSNSGKFTQKITAVIDPMSTVRSDYEDSSVVNTSTTDATKIDTSLFTPKKEENVVINNKILPDSQSKKTTLQKSNWNKMADVGQTLINQNVNGWGQTIIS